MAGAKRSIGFNHLAHDTHYYFIAYKMILNALSIENLDMCGNPSRSRLPHPAHDYFWRKMRSNAKTAFLTLKKTVFAAVWKAIVWKKSKKRDFSECPGAKRRTLALYQNKRPNTDNHSDFDTNAPTTKSGCIFGLWVHPKRNVIWLCDQGPE